MNALYLLMVIVGVSVQQVARKAYNTRVTGGTYSFPAASAFVALLFFVVSSGGEFRFSPEILGYSVLFAFSYGVSVVSSLLAIGCGPLSLTALMIQYSLIVPAVYGLIALDETPGLLLVVGIVLLLISLVFINMEKKGEEKKISLRWGLYAFLAFAGNGMCSTVQKVQQLDFNGLYKNEFMITALAMVFTALLCIAFFTERKTIFKNLKFGAVWYILCGSANGMVNLLVLVLSLALPASVMFPIISAGGIILTTLISVFVYKEKLSSRQKIGFLLGIGAIVLLNL